MTNIPGPSAQESLIDLGVDFETFYDDEYSLKKMENAQYVMDPRFEIIGVSLKPESLPAVWITGTLDELRHELSKLPWDRIRVVAHNARFDASILEWRLGLRPAEYLCTMVGSRPHYVGKVGSVSLRSIAKHLELGEKGDDVERAAGKHRADFTPEGLKAYGEYSCNDSELSMGIAKNLLTIMPKDELDLIDITLKKYLRPQLYLNPETLVTRLAAIDREREAMLTRVLTQYGVTLEQLRSRPKFAQVLEACHVRVPMKTGKSKKNPGQMTYAFAKDDLEFKRLLTHADQKVRDLVAAKLAVSSSMEASRIERLIDLAGVMNNMLPVPYVYYGAHPGRLSGDEKINMQNMPRVEYHDDKVTLKKGHMRFAVVAAPGYEIVEADFSNIEARMVATLAEEWDLVRAFAEGRDVYSEFATQIYGYKVDKKIHKKERFVGKTCILGLGYGMGWAKFQLKMAQEGILIDEREAKRIVYLYRETYPGIKKLWDFLEFYAGKIITDPAGLFAWGPITFAHERILLPNGMPIMYPDLAKGPDGLKFRSRKYQSIMDDEGVAGYAEGSKIWGGHFLENVSQGLARIVATTAELSLLRKYQLRAALQTHDSLAFHIPKVLVARVEAVVEHEMTQPVSWLPRLPIAVEIGHGPTYGECK